MFVLFGAADLVYRTTNVLRPTVFLFHACVPSPFSRDLQEVVLRTKVMVHLVPLVPGVATPWLARGWLPARAWAAVWEEAWVVWVAWEWA